MVANELSFKAIQQSGIYMIYCFANEKYYIGSSQNVGKRMRAHRNELRANKHKNTILQHTWNKHGEDAFVFGLVEITNVSQLLIREQHWLDMLLPYEREYGFNISGIAGASTRGLTLSEEHRAKLGESSRGRHHTDETKARMSVNHNTVVTPSMKEAVRRANLGRKASPQTRARMSVAHQNPSPELRYKFGSASRGKKKTPEAIAKFFEARAKEYIVITPDGEEIRIKGLALFCREHGLNRSAMAQVRQGKANHHKGWRIRDCE